MTSNYWEYIQFDRLQKKIDDLENITYSMVNSIRNLHKNYLVLEGKYNQLLEEYKKTLQIPCSPLPCPPPLSLCLNAGDPIYYVDFPRIERFYICVVEENRYILTRENEVLLSADGQYVNGIWVSKINVDSNNGKYFSTPEGATERLCRMIREAL